MWKSLTAAAVSLALSGVTIAAEKPKLNDAQIAHIAYTAGEIDIAAAKQALEKSHTQEVRAFADQMVADHTAVNDKATELVKKLGVTPEPNPTSTALSDAAKQKLANYSKLNDRAFDRAYINNEVAFHKTVDDSLRTTLIPEAKNSELKQLLQTGLKLFQQHQMHAEELAGKLGQKNAQLSK
jgi:putative membrane protein